MKILAILLLAASLHGGEMIQVRKSNERGQGDHGWLTAQYTFSFADYHDSDFMGFRALKVINEDIVDPKKGFDTHPHNDMEILTYVLEGAIEHKDTLGNHAQIRAGEFQLQTAGTGIEHSEYNPSKKEKVHLLQIWIQPEKKGLTPGYQQMSFASHKEVLQLVASRNEGPMKIHQDTKIYLGRLGEGKEATLALAKGRHAWIQMVKGNVDVNDVSLEQGDGAAISNEEQIAFKANEESEFLVFDLK